MVPCILASKIPEITFLVGRFRATPPETLSYGIIPALRSAFVRTIYCFFFFFFFFTFSGQIYVKLILEQMVSTTKSTRFVSCDCSRQIHHARFLHLILFISSDKDRSRSSCSSSFKKIIESFFEKRRKKERNYLLVYIYYFEKLF